MLADEPIGALDAQTAHEIMELLREVNANDGIPTLVITHDRQIALQCTRRTRVIDGRLREST